MTSWPSKSTLQRLLDLAGLRYTTAERLGPFWQACCATSVQALVVSRLDSTAMLFWLGLPIKHNQPLQIIQNASGTTGLQWAQKSPCYTSLHLTALATSGSSHQVQDTDACIQNDHRLSTTSTHYYESTSPPEVWDLLVSDALWYHHREAQNHSPEHSHSPFLDGGIIFPPLSGTLDPCQSSSNNWKLISFGTTWLHPKLVLKKKKKKKIFPFIFLSFPC